MNEGPERIGFLESLRIVSRALKISYHTKGWVSSLISVLGFGAAFLPLLIAASLRTFVDTVQRLGAGEAKALNGAFRGFTILASLYLLQTLFNSVRSYYSKVDTINVHRYIKERIMRCTCDIKYKYIDNFDDFKEKVTFADTYAGHRVANSMQTMVIWVQNLITFASIVFALLRIDSRIVVLLAAACFPAAVLSYLQRDEDYRGRTKHMKEGTFVIRYFHDTVDHFTQNEIRFFGIFGYVKQKWRDMAHTFVGLKNAITRKHVLYNAAADLLRNGVLIAVLLIGAKRIFENPALGLGTFMLVLTMAGQFQEVTTRLLVDAAQFAGDIRYMKDFFDLDRLEYEKRTKDEEPYESADIQLENVDFTYPNTTRRVLRDLNLTIKQGEKIAVVGENGSGKTTFVSLLCGMNEPDSGSVTVNGRPIADHLSKVRRSMSVVFQDFSKYETSIRENITISDSSKSVTDDRLKELAERTGAYGFIKDQKRGFDEIVGSFSQEGNIYQAVSGRRSPSPGPRFGTALGS